MLDTFETPLLDRVALEEIELTSRLMIAASGCARPMTQGEVDHILGVTSAT